MTLELPIWQRNEKELIEDNNAQTFLCSYGETQCADSGIVSAVGIPLSAQCADARSGCRCKRAFAASGTRPGRRVELHSKIPETREQLAKFDVVFLGDVGIGDKELTREQCELLRGLVEQQGSGLIFMPGKRSPADLNGSPLGDLIPWSWIEANRKDCSCRVRPTLN